MGRGLLAFIVFSACVIPIILIGVLGKHWGEKWIKEGLITRDDMYNLGYIGCFFAKIFGF